VTITVEVELGYEFEVHSPAAEVFAVLADVPQSASHYPQVQQLSPLGDGAYRWDMQPIGIGSLQLQTIYASKYVADAAKGSVEWTPVDGVGNARVSGNWKITERPHAKKPSTTHIVLTVQGTLTLPLPALMKMVAAPMVEAEFERLTEQYIHNLIQRFGGEV
jgi:carbon monoxide dehydrogenase subunit G